MAAYDIEQQEQLDALKSFWARWGNAITWTLTVIFSAIAAYYGWQYFQRREALAAGLLYEQLEKAVTDKNLATVKDATGQIIEKHGSTVYAQMAALKAAKAMVDGKDVAGAKAQLTWAADKSRDESYRVIARVRLAGLLLDEKKYDEALAQLKPPGLQRLAPLVADRRGDVLAAQGKREEAIAAFLEAYQGMEEGDAARTLVQQKLEALGGSVPASSKPVG
jgi:predicted negative regulator of RcsB-dependent stress response